MSNSYTLILGQGKPFAFTFDLAEDDGTTPIPLPVNCGFRMHIRAKIADETPKLVISSTGDTPYASRVGETFQIAVPSTVTAAIAGARKAEQWATDIELFDLDSGECVQDGGAYVIQWMPEVTR